MTANLRLASAKPSPAEPLMEPLLTAAEVDREAWGNVVEIPRVLVQRIRTILPKCFDRLTEAEQEEYFKLLSAEWQDDAP